MWIACAAKALCERKIPKICRKPSQAHMDGKPPVTDAAYRSVPALVAARTLVNMAAIWNRNALVIRRQPALPRTWTINGRREAVDQD